MIYLLDTMVLCEPSKTRPHSAVTAWLKAQAAETLAISTISLGEVVFGVQKLTDSALKTKLLAWAMAGVRQAFGPRVLPVDAAVAEHWAAVRLRVGRTLPALDALIAATALAHDLTLVTRNGRDFRDTGVRLFDPWSSS